MINRKLFSNAGALMLFTLWASPPAGAEDLHGTVRLDGPVPAPEIVTVEPKKGVHSTEGCGSLQKPSQKLQVNPSGGVKNAVVWLDLPSQTQSSNSNEPPILMDQKECIFNPHVAVTTPGRALAIRNSDPALHNIRIFREGNPSMLMHQWQKADALDILWRFTEPGRYIVRCGVHPWMYAWAVVMPHNACAVTDDSGGFTIPAVPPGKYTLHVWHETLGTLDQPIRVKEGNKELLPITLAHKPSASYQF